jgi:hypothetical protein
MKISNTILAVFQLKNEMSAKAAQKFMANLDNSFYVCAVNTGVCATAGSCASFLQGSSCISKFVP